MRGKWSHDSFRWPMWEEKKKNQHGVTRSGHKFGRERDFLGREKIWIAQGFWHFNTEVGWGIPFKKHADWGLMMLLFRLETVSGVIVASMWTVHPRFWKIAPAAGSPKKKTSGKNNCFGLITFDSEVVMSWKYAENDRMIRLMGRCEIFYFSWKVVKWSILGETELFSPKLEKKGVLTFFRPNLLLNIFKTFFWLGVFKLPLSIGNSLRSSHHL